MARRAAGPPSAGDGAARNPTGTARAIWTRWRSPRQLGIEAIAERLESHIGQRIIGKATAVGRVLIEPRHRGAELHHLEHGEGEGFQNKVDDYIDGVEVFDGSPPFGFSFQYQNIAKAKLEGLELEAMYDARKWFLGLSATHIRGTDEDTGDPLLTIPADQVVVTGGVRLFGEKLLAGGRLRFVADQDRVPTGVVASDAFTTVDLFGQYIVNDNVTLNLNLDNLLDKAYIQYRDQSYSPGFNAKLAVTVRFGAE